MSGCKRKKRLQIYLDGWMDERDSEQFENHLRRCDECQTELFELEEISSSALEIVDHAPERDYWESFFTRAHNRINSRGVTPYVERESQASGLKLTSYTVGIMAIAAVLILTFSYLSRGPRHSDSEAQVSGEKESRSVAASGAIVSEQELITKIAVIPEAPPSAAEFDKIDLRAEKPADVDIDYSDTISAISDKDYQSAFRGSIRLKPGELWLSEDENFVSRLLAEYDGLADDSFSVNPNVVAEGIISGYASGGNGRNGLLFTGRGLGTNDAINPGWGYLGLPGDTTRSDEFHRYLIELDIMRAK